MNQQLPPNQPYPQHLNLSPVAKEDEIDLKEIFLVLWKGKWIVLLFTIIFAVGGGGYALSQPNVYKATAVLVSSSDNGKSGMAAMASQFGGLASLAGINIGEGRTDSKAMALAVLQSRQFINSFIHRHDLLVPLMASTKWNEGSGELELNRELYDVTTKQWVRQVPTGQSVVPTDWEAYKAFKEILSNSEDKISGLVSLSITHYSPVIAQQWVAWLVSDLNSWMKEKSLSETKRNIGYLEQQLDKTNISDMRTVFFQLIEEQTKNLMLAEVETEFAFKTIDPAVIPEEKAGPKRTLICVLATLAGGMFGALVVLALNFTKGAYTTETT
ncbi:Wzz/FepE/Etk N-terminal domain-containing protein [Vibrio nigripulchritudo]|uniref:Wzz/FepE/Etk N-terminal domain-containing protein n=1 Tax=Vibrio nigripulchritudo TaxID=28173 RepID=UPI0024916CA4|nr:Wzz/FepE/Etk N-terminal domain-containing protein [Vibrio nigripulchritudo]BDU38874.1 LPS biosynthesis protein [Vibrio nigripulchritudo]BDU44594.1 LPS biosynthesis protein [Vibrio nigripulchritudo]